MSACELPCHVIFFDVVVCFSTDKNRVGTRIIGDTFCVPVRLGRRKESVIPRRLYLTGDRVNANAPDEESVRVFFVAYYGISVSAKPCDPTVVACRNCCEMMLGKECYDEKNNRVKHLIKIIAVAAHGLPQQVRSECEMS